MIIIRTFILFLKERENHPWLAYLNTDRQSLVIKSHRYMHRRKPKSIENTAVNGVQCFVYAKFGKNRRTPKSWINKYSVLSQQILREKRGEMIRAVNIETIMIINAVENKKGAKYFNLRLRIISLSN